MQTIRTLVLGLLGVLFLSPVSAWGEGNIHLGKLKINPFVSVSETLSDNIYYTSTEEQRDNFTTTTPGIKLQFPFRVHQADLEYYSKLTRYDKNKGENTTDQYANGSINLKFGGLVRVRLWDNFALGHEPRSSSSTGFIEKYRSNTMGVTQTYQLADRSKIQVDIARTGWTYKTSDYRNRDENLVSGYFYYRLLSKTSAFIEYDRRQVTFTDPSFDYDNNMDSVLLGLTWEMSERTKGTIKAGTTDMVFVSPALQGFKGSTSSVDVRHAFTDATSLTLIGQRSVNQTSVQNNRYVLTTGAFAELTHQFIRRLSGAVRGSYGVDNYADPVVTDPVTNEMTVRTDRSLLGGLGLKYAMKDWLEFSLDYNQKTRRSNIPVNDYNEHSYILSASISL